MPNSLTPQQIEQGRNFTEAQKARFNRAVVSGSDPIQAFEYALMAEKETTSRPSPIREAISQIPQDLASGYRNVARDFNEQGFETAVRNAPVRLVGGLGRAVGTGFGGVFGQADESITGGRVGDALGGVIEGAVNTPLGQDLVRGATAINQATDGIAGDVLDAFNIAGVGALASQPANQLRRQIINSARRTGTQAVEGVSRGSRSLREIVGGKTVANVAPENVTPEIRQQAVDKLADVYKNSLVENRQSINNKLDDLAKGASFGGNKLNRNDLLRELAEEGYVPEVEGRLARFNEVFSDIDTRQQNIMNGLQPILNQSRATVNTDAFKQQIINSIKTNPQIVGGLTRAESELDRLFTSYKSKFGDELTANQVNEIRKDANAITKAYKDSDKFQADTASLVGGEARKWLDENIPDNAVREANAEWARLNRIRETAEVLNNQQIDVGLFGRALGSYVTTIAGATAGITVGGPGGLVVAGLLAKIGGDKFADMLRKNYFNKKVTDQIRTVLRQDEELLRRLSETANKQNQEYLSKFALPPAGGSSFREPVTNLPSRSQSTLDKLERVNPNIIAPQ